MLRTNTARWRIAFLSGFGILPNACGGHTEGAAPGEGDTASGTTTPGGTTAPGGTTTPRGTTIPSSFDTPDGSYPPLQTASPAAGTACVNSVPYSKPYITPLVQTGLERCEDGRLHRPTAVECISKLTPPGSSDAGAAGAGAADSGAATDRIAPGGSTANNSCTADGDCTARPLGHCESHPLGGTPDRGKTCDYGCQVDADCGPGFLCECGERVGACVPANCRVDSDCGSGLLCARGTRARYPGCETDYEFFCERPDDACRLDEDCAPAPATYGSYCAATDGAHVCKAYPGGSCGRPFLVEGRARLAELARSSEWCVAREASPDCSRLSAAERAELARAWSQLGLMEHASVAAFARFTLQLLSVGAPIALLEQSQQALSDELLHARLCFGLASAYAGEPIGPGPLPTEHALDLHSLEDIAALTLHEGCVGETIAAIEASEALALAVDPAVRATLARIQDDERRHAELGWRFVTWAIQTGGASVQRRIQRELAELVGQAPEAWRVEETSSFDTAPHGILSARQRAELRAAALRDVVLPCARALLPAAEVSVCRDDCAA